MEKEEVQYLPSLEAEGRGQSFSKRAYGRTLLQLLLLVVVKGNVTLFQGTSKFSNLHKRDRKMLLLLLPYLPYLNSSVKKKESLIKFGN